MHLTERERERLLLAAAADLARRRIARGARIGATEAIALVCDEVCEMAWDGADLATVVEHGRTVVPRDLLLPGAAALAPSVQVEALFPHGSTLVHVPEPFGPAEADQPGAARPARDEVDLAPGRRRSMVTVQNTGTLAVWVSSHVPLDALNPALDVRPSEPGRWRLDLPSGVATRLEAGSTTELTVVEVLGDAS